MLVDKSGPCPLQSPGVSGLDGDLAAHVRQQIAVLKQKVQETGQHMDQCKQEQEAFSVEYYTFRERNVQFESFVAQHGEQHPDVKKHRTSKESMEKAIKDKVGRK